MLINNRVTRRHTLEKLRQKEFAVWLHNKVLVGGEFDDNTRTFALMPSKQAICFNAYDVNGFRFHTEAHAEGKSTINSGVCVKGEGSDNIQRDYYGILQEIIELEYQGVGNKVINFKCLWFNITNGIRVDEHGFVEVKHTSTLRGNDNFIYACQAIQVYYLPYASEKRQQWWIAMKTRRKEKFGAENVEAVPEFFQGEHPYCQFLVSIEHDHYENPLLEWRPLQPLDISDEGEGDGDGGEIDDEYNYDNANVEHVGYEESDQEE